MSGTTKTKTKRERKGKLFWLKYIRFGHDLIHLAFHLMEGKLPNLSTYATRKLWDWQFLYNPVWQHVIIFQSGSLIKLFMKFNNVAISGKHFGIPLSELPSEFPSCKRLSLRENVKFHFRVERTFEISLSVDSHTFCSFKQKVSSLLIAFLVSSTCLYFTLF